MAEGVKHSEACHERFKSLLGKKMVKSKKKLLNLLKPNRRQGKESLQRSKPKSTATFSNPKLSHPCLPVKPQCLESCDKKSNEY